MNEIPDLYGELTLAQKAAVVRSTGCSDIQKGLRQWQQIGLRLEDNPDVLESLFETVRFAEESGYAAAPRKELYRHPGK